MFDIDHFKNVNDTYGHHIGDVVLVGMTDIVKTHIRDVDTLARWGGGEEFIIIVIDSKIEEALMLQKE